MPKEILKCGKVPCEACPYKRETPPGIWAAHEYEKLRAYDGSIIEQVVNGGTGAFLCHAQPGHLCAGWVGTHDMQNNLALRLAASGGAEIDPMVFTYTSPKELYASGNEAADAGLAGVEAKSDAAEQGIQKLMRKHKRLRDQKESEGC